MYRLLKGLQPKVNNDKGVFLEERGKRNSVERVTIVRVPKQEKFFWNFFTKNAFEITCIKAAQMKISK